uniref:DEAD/DEAH box helicase n=1 Tax=Novosphingobium rosa TaxID=76978 RepID=UPI000A4CC133
MNLSPPGLSPDLPEALEAWFAGRGWQVRRHQLEMLAAAQSGAHALLMADTGSGKTLAGFLPTLADAVEGRIGEGLHTIYVSPLKALAQDVRRGLMMPVADLGLDLRIETRSGDTSSERKARQRSNPPHVLLTTPESLALLISYPESAALFSTVKRVVVDEIHAFAQGKRGDLLALTLARIQSLSPQMRRVGLSATLADPEAYRGWLAPGGRRADVALVLGDPGAPAQVEVMLPEGARIPWSGHAAAWAVPQIMAAIRAHRTTLIFTNTRFLAEYIFQLLWDVNEENLPIGIHHGSLGREARAKVEEAMAQGRLRGLVCTASLDLGVDWGDVDLVIQMGAPKGSSRLLQRVGRANHRLDEPSRALLVPGNRFEFLEAMAARDAVAAGERDG